MNDTRFSEYNSNLNRCDNSIYRPIKFATKPIESPNKGLRARSDKEKADLVDTYLAEVFTSQDNIHDQEVLDNDYDVMPTNKRKIQTDHLAPK